MARYITRETEPYGKWKGIPVYLTTVLTAVFILGLLVTTVLRSAGSPLLQSLVLTFPMAMPAGLIGLITYPFMGLPNFFTPFGILCFFFWARGIETHLGRAALSKLLILLTAIPAIFYWAWWHFGGVPSTRLGNYEMTIGLVVAFATLYPSSEVWGFIPFKYFAAFCVGCALLIPIGDRDWAGVASIAILCIAAFLFIRHAIEREHDDHIPLAARIRSFFRRKPKLRVVRQPAHTLYREHPHTEHTDDFQQIEAELDGLLDKIARNGIESLTPAERRRLDKGREALLNKDRK